MATKPRLGITTRPIEKGVSGSGMHLDRLLSAFVRLDHGFDLFFLHHSEKKLDLYHHGRACRISRNPLVAAGQVSALDLDILHFSPLSIFSPMLAKVRFRCATLHPDDELIIPECYPWYQRLHSRKLVGAYARRMDRVFTVSNTSRDLISREYGLKAERIVLTPNATDAKYRVVPHTDLVEVHRRYTGGRPFVLHVSNCSARKNPWTILRAFARVATNARHDSLMMLIVGNGWAQDPAVPAFLKEHRLEKRVLLTGFIPEGDLPRLFNLARVFVFPSLSEGFGMPNLEAMACGCPVITSDAFAIPEVVGDAAIILKDKRDDAELAATIERLLTEPEASGRLHEAGLRRAQDFSWNTSAQRLLQTYRQLFSSET